MEDAKTISRVMRMLDKAVKKNSLCDWEKEQCKELINSLKVIHQNFVFDSYLKTNLNG